MSVPSNVDATRLRFEQPYDAARQGGLAAARLPDDADRGSGLDRERHPIDRPNHLPAPPKQRLAHGEMAD